MDENELDFTKFSEEEIEVAMSNYDPKVVLGEGGFGIVYKGILRGKIVAIKMLKDGNSNGERHFRQEVEVLSKVRHDNLVILLGACPEKGVLVYEFLPGGTLDDRLARRNHMPGLTFQDRIRVATEICSALTFLHSQNIVHGDLKPTNILFDDNGVIKLIDFGICRILPHSTTTAHLTTRLKDNDGYLDPLYTEGWRLTTKMDVYAFGVILLRLLTNQPPWKLVHNIEKARDKGHIKELLDITAKWPKNNVAEKLTEVALKCCVLHWGERADLTAVLPSLNQIKTEHGNDAAFKSRWRFW